MKNLFAKRIVDSSDIKNVGFLLKEDYLQVDLAVTNDVVLHDKDFLILDFGKEISGGIRILTSHVSKDNKVRIRFGESISEACSDIGPESGATNDHSTRDMVVNLPFLSDLTFGQTGFRFVRFDFSGEFWMIQHIAAALDIDQREEVGIFNSDDKFLNEIWDAASYTLRLNLHNGLIWDGVKRDRLCWIGDAYNEIKAVMCLYDKQDEIANVIDFSVPSIDAIIKRKGTANIPSTYCLWWILILILKYEHDFDKEYLLSYKKLILDIINYFNECTKENGDIFSGRNFIDWPSHPLDDGSPEDEFKKSDEMVGVRALTLLTYQKLKETLNKVNEHSFDDVLTSSINFLDKANYDILKFKQCAAFTYFAGKANKQNIDVLSTGGANGLSTFQSYFILAALGELNLYDEALDSLKEYYGGMLSLGATTFFEDFDIKWLENANRIDEPLQPGKIDFHLTYGQFCYKKLRHSLCHGWGAGVIPYIVEYVIGLKQVGKNEFTVSPHMSYLKHISYTYPLVNGRIFLEIFNNNGKLDIKVSCPENIKINIIK
jgi:hypothetical protein